MRNSDATRLARPVAAIAVAALALSGCGGTTSEAQAKSWAERQFGSAHIRYASVTCTHLGMPIGMWECYAWRAPTGTARPRHGYLAYCDLTGALYKPCYRSSGGTGFGVPFK